MINLAREPRWGRNLETPGEDPYLTGEYAAAFVTGFEHSPDDPKYLQASPRPRLSPYSSPDGEEVPPGSPTTTWGLPDSRQPSRRGTHPIQPVPHPSPIPTVIIQFWRLLILQCLRYSLVHYLISLLSYFMFITKHISKVS